MVSRQHGVSFDPRDDMLLLTLLAKYGRKWKDIQKKYNDKRKSTLKRSISSLRNRWQRIRRGAVEESAANCTRCGTCGEPKTGHVCLFGVNDITKNDLQRLIACAERMEADDEGDDGSDSASTTEVVIDSLASAPLDDDEDDVLLVKDVLSVRDDVLSDGMSDGMIESSGRVRAPTSVDVLPVHEEQHVHLGVQVANELLALPDAFELDGILTELSDDVSREEIVKAMEMQDEDMLYDIDEDDLKSWTSASTSPMH